MKKTSSGESIFPTTLAESFIYGGLTKRELIAAMIVSGIKDKYSVTHRDVVEFAVERADALLKELKETEN